MSMKQGKWFSIWVLLRSAKLNMWDRNQPEPQYLAVRLDLQH